MTAEIIIEGGAETAAWLEKTAARFGVVTGQLMGREGQHLQAAVMRHASGRPGPNAPTGDFRRSITPPAIDYTDGIYTATVGTNKPQGMRLEYGFSGTDSLGRKYDQPPYPSFGPAADERAPEFEKACREMVDALLAERT